MTIDDFRILFRKDLAGISEPEEVENLCFLTLEHVLTMNRVEVSLSRKQNLSQSEQSQLSAILERLKTSEPIQYIIGSTEFYGLEYQVNPATLIPRPETEELVEWILEAEKGTSLSSQPLQLLDVGTGSGCIAITLARNLPNANVDAIDISKNALATAYQNAQANEATVTFYDQNILEVQQLEKKYDIIVSNPPYVRILEKQEMRANVLENEPDTALFVPDDDPLLFYRKIGTLALTSLCQNGMLFFEINEYLGDETVSLLKKIGFTDIQLRKDMFGKNRMIKAMR